jgi:hypothetical protein
MRKPKLLSPDFGAKSQHIFTQSAQSVKSVCGIDYLSSQNELILNNPLDVKEFDEHALEFALHLCLLFSVSVCLDSSIGNIITLSQGHNRKSISPH